MEPVFENKYLMSKERFFKWLKRPVTRDIFIYFWIVMAIFIIVLMIISIMSNDIFFITFYIFLELFCIYRLFFRNKLLLSKQFKTFMITQGREEWERVLKFSGNIIVIDGNTSGEYKWSQVKELIDDKDYFILVMRKRLGIRIDKNGFTKGSCETFLEFIKKEHSNIPIKVRK